MADEAAAMDVEVQQEGNDKRKVNANVGTRDVKCW